MQLKCLLSQTSCSVVICTDADFQSMSLVFCLRKASFEFSFFRQTIKTRVQRKWTVACCLCFETQCTYTLNKNSLQNMIFIHLEACHLFKLCLSLKYQCHLPFPPLLDINFFSVDQKSSAGKEGAKATTCKPGLAYKLVVTAQPNTSHQPHRFCNRLLSFSSRPWLNESCLHHYG